MIPAEFKNEIDRIVNVLRLGQYEIRLYPVLPIPETAQASDIETRKEISVPTGNEIHILQTNQFMLVSQRVLDELMPKITLVNL